QDVGLANRGVLHTRRRRWEDAVRDFRQATQVKPDGFQAYVNLALALQELKRWDDAVAAVDQAIQRAPKLPVLYQARARLHVARGRWARAREDFDRAIALEPAGSASQLLVDCHIELGRLLHQRGEYAA